ncbi:papain-like cysteine protease family protein [Neorhizobium galegae]|nr:papain-like cysteine protease family protein [Neorhizobium galegae]MCQ1850990.1 hypothetical protein [Neorhizobium galegae]
MKRRQLLKSFAALGVGSLVSPQASYAYSRCMAAMNPMGKVCESGVKLPRVQHSYRDQELNQWCWAASISMIFAFHGYRVSQREIVKAVYGREVNLPAMAGRTISSQLSRDWVDNDGLEFSVEIEGLYDFDAGITGLTNSMIIDALNDERPLIMGTRSHAMVLTSIAYVPVPGNPQIFNIGLADPWPGAGLRGARNRGELYPMHLGGDLRYLALPKVV